MKPRHNKLLSLAIFIGCLCQRKRTKQTVNPNQRENDIEIAVAAGTDHTANAYNVLDSSFYESAALAGTKSSGAEGMMLFRNTSTLSNLENLLRDSADVLGRGTSGTTYKACMELDMTMAVRRLKDVNVSEMEFRERIEAIGKINHENLVPLRAYCFMDHKKFLLYDYMPMGSLSTLLHGNKGAENGKTRVNWDTRIGIALGAARAIVHLHSLVDHPMSHGNIKSSNILLTATFVALVSEFGLAYAAGPSAVPHLSDGYRAPEVNDSSNVSQKADVYSFGVVLLELLTGKDPTESHLIDDGIDLATWILAVVEDELTSEVFELELLQHENVEEEMLQLLQLAFTCSAQDPDNRPSMAEVCSRIEEIFYSSSRVYETHTDVEGVNSTLTSMPTPSLRLLYW